MINIQELDTERLEMAASMLKATAHPMRIAILKHLEGGKKLTVTEFMNYWESNNQQLPIIWGY